MKKSGLIGLAAAVSMSLAACGQRPVELCHSEAGAGLDHAPEITTIYNGTTDQHKLCEIDGYSLKEDTRYHFSNGLLVVNGDIPSDTDIYIDEGRIEINGNVGSNANISAGLPENYRTESTMTLMPFPNGNGGVTMKPMPQTTTHFDGYTYAQDANPSVRVNGYVNEGAHIQGNRAIEIEGSHDDAQISVIHPQP